MKKLGITVIVIIISGMVFVLSSLSKPSKISSSRLISLPSTNDDYARAESIRTFSFPKDHGPHPEFQTEWWYYTGNLISQDGKHFGYQLTFFRRSIVPITKLEPRGSNWAADQVYLAHFTLTDVSKNEFYYYEKLERGAANLAGASGEPTFSVWLHDWQVAQTADNSYTLQAAANENKIVLSLMDSKKPILHGNNGLSQKGPELGNASYYISQTRLISSGVIKINDEEYQVTGNSWMDHEFSTSALSGEQIGWDWFSIQLDNNTEIMVYKIRRSDGSQDPFSAGTIVYPDRNVRTLTIDDFSIEETAKWKSPNTNTLYPSRWTIEIPSENIYLEIKPMIPDQELRVSFTYWEGAVLVEGIYAGSKVSGYGYVELTGYSESMQGTF